LQVKLIVAVLALVTVALVLIGLASVAALDRYLVGRLDTQLQAVAEHSAEEGPPGGFEGPPGQRRGPPSPYLVQYRTADGQVKHREQNELPDQGEPPPRVPDDGAWLKAKAGKVVTVPATGGHGRWRVAVQPLDDGSGGSVVVAASLDGIDSTTRQLRLIDLGVSLVVLAVLAGVGAAIVRASLRPLVEIEQTARAIAAGDLTRRVPDRDPRTEVGRLGRALNTMLAQIETAFGARAASEAAARRSEDRMRRFVADASHELRTPLTTIRGFAELYRQGAARDPAELDRLMRRIEDQAARMGLLVEDLLLLARLDRQRPLTLAPVELPVLAMDAVQAARAIAPERKIELEMRDDPEKLVAYGDDARLRQVVGNLMTNALVHTPPDASVTLRLYAVAGNRAVMEIADTGPGLPEGQREHVFERFYRADEARTRHTDRAASGTGLGLAIVAAIVRAHHGTVEVESEPGQGATFRVTLPALEPG
jgi:two-component system OmpR family sensor kinase